MIKGLYLSGHSPFDSPIHISRPLCAKAADKAMRLSTSFTHKIMIKERLISALIASLFMVIFRPFGLDHFGWMRWPLLTGACVIITIACVGGEYIVRYVLGMPHAPERGMKYLIRRNVCFQLGNMALFVSLMMLYLDRFVCNAQVDNHLSWALFAKLLLVFLGVSLIISMYWKNVYWKRHYAKELEAAWHINGMLAERQRAASTAGPEKKTETETPITLCGTTKEHVTVLPSAFLYAASEGNYVHVYHLVDGKVVSTMIRTTLKEVETAFTDTGIIRCHRAYIVNPRHVARVVSRSSGFMVELQPSGALIPVSKTYTAAIRQRLANP